MLLFFFGVDIVGWVVGRVSGVVGGGLLDLTLFLLAIVDIRPAFTRA